MSKKKPNTIKPAPQPNTSVGGILVHEAPFQGFASFFRQHLWQCGLIILLGLGIYLRGMHYDYVLDDTIVIKDNNFTKAGVKGIWDILTTESMTGYFGESKNLVQGNRYRPLSLVTFAIEYEIMGGLNPTVSHLGNITIYILSCVLIFWLLTNLLGSRYHFGWGMNLAFVASILFAVHPLHVEAVANIKGRDELMAMLFAVWSMVLALKHIKNPQTGTLIGALVLFFLGLLSKENTFTFLAVIPLGLYFFTQQSWGRVWSGFWPFLVVAMAYLILRTQVSGPISLDQVSRDLMNNPFVEMTTGQKYATILYTLWEYLRLLLIPHPLTHDYYPYAIPIMSWSDPMVLLSLLLHLGAVGYALWNIRKDHIVSFSIWYYLATLSIVSNVVINLGTFMNDRFIYMSSLAYGLLLGYGVYQLAHKWLRGNQIISIGILAVVSIVYAYLSFARVPAWENAMTLNQSAIKVSKNSARANSFMSTALFNAYLESQDPEEKRRLILEAEPYAYKAIDIHKTYLNGHIMAVGVAAEIYKMDNDLDKLLQVFYKSAVIRPDVSFITEYCRYLNGRADREKMVQFYVKVGTELTEKNNTKWAEQYLKLGLEMAPNDTRIHTGLSLLYQKLGDNARAQYHYQLSK